MKNIKGILKKIFKFLLIIVILFMVYVLINFFYSKNLLVNVIKAINEDDVERIYELTGDKFFESTTYFEDGEKNTYYYNVYDYLNRKNGLYLCEKGLESNSLSIKSVKPYWGGFAYDVEVTSVPYETLISSGENLKRFLETEYPVLLTEYLRAVSTNKEINDCQKLYDLIMSEFSQKIYLDDVKFKEEKHSMTTELAGYLGYNIFTRKFEENGLVAIYDVKKGVYPIYKCQYMMSIDIQELEEIDFYDRDGNRYYLEFYGDDFISVYSYKLDGSRDNNEWIQTNRQFIETEASKVEILTYLEQEGYIFADETLKFIAPDDVVEAAFYNGNLIWLSLVKGENFFKKDLSKEDVITLLKSYNYYLEEKLF